MLFIVATPIGNLADISLRALDVFKSVDLIACEDTRHTKILLSKYGIKTPTTSFFQHNRFVKAGYLLSLLKEGKNIALVSDAGTPGILDPGYNLISQAIAAHIAVTVIPGATAFVNALVLSGKPAHRFMFEGFLPNKPISRKNRLRELAKLDCTIVFYESCHRILETLEDVGGIWPGKQVVVARELTKKFEEIIRDDPVNIQAHLKSRSCKGEFVVVV